jgi:hypothetical protein
MARLSPTTILWAVAAAAAGAAPLMTMTTMGGCAKISTLDNGAGGVGGGAGGRSTDVDAGHHPERGVTPDASQGCVNLQCQQMLCANGGHTTVTGTVYAPNGTLPLYDAMVYVPNAPVPPLPKGLSCDRCGVLPAGSPLVGALTDTHGVFTLKDVPVGNDIPLVVQIGKWRRQVTIPTVMPCTDNPLTDPELTRLPRNRSEGDMPHIAITTGACDNLICMMPRLGIDPSEWGIAGEDTAVTFFHGDAYDGNPLPPGLFDAHLGRMTSATDLWSSRANLEQYDMVIASCECALPTVSAAAYQAMTDYIGEGGRLFTTDLQYVWYKNSPDPNLSGSMDINLDTATKVGKSPIALDTSFPKGQSFVDWLSYISPASPAGSVDAYQVWNNFISVTRPAWQVWGSSASLLSNDVHPRLLSINAPAGLPADQQCGRAVHLDAHISSIGVGSSTTTTFPASCGTNLAVREQAMAFFMFDVAACIQDDTLPPPPIVP